MMEPATTDRKTLPRSRLELGVLLSLLVIVGGIWGFVELAEAVGEGATKQFDESVLRVFRDPAQPAQLRGPKWLYEVSRDATALGGYLVLTLVTVAVCGFLAMVGNLPALRFIAISVTGGLALSLGLKALFERPRPDVVEHLSYVATSSFPSGHSMMSAVVYLSMGALLSRFAPGRALRLYCLLVAIFLTGIVGISRMMMGVHFPTDVFGGWTAGLVWATGCWLVARRWQKTHPEARPAE